MSSAKLVRQRKELVAPERPTASDLEAGICRRLTERDVYLKCIMV